jgi:ferredoxin hydrogenase large subunit/hydrogenase large subunit
MQKTVVVDPVTRVEGHLAIRLEVESNRVVKAYSSGEMFRGFEVILKGRSPLDAQQITQRICGVCPVSHGMASVLAQDEAYGVAPPGNGVLGRNLIQAANFIQSHITHFYQLSALDFIDITAVSSYSGKDPSLNELKSWVQSQLASKILYPAAPFLPRYSGEYIRDEELNLTAVKHYLESMEMRALAHKMGAVFAGKLPHAPGLIPGGITEKITTDKIVAYKSMLNRLQSFIEESYLPDVLEVAKAFPEYLEQGKGCGSFLSQGVFPSAGSGSMLLPSGVLIRGSLKAFDPSKITEETRYSFYSSPSGLHPAAGQTVPAHHRSEAYSWVKAPRYEREVVEVGPLARITIAALKSDNPVVKTLVNQVLASLNLNMDHLVSAMGRHLARAIECKIVADQCAEWVEELKPGEPAFRDFDIPETGNGAGLTEASRGSLGHWLEIRGGRVEKYQCVVPTTWNCSPRDDQGKPGAVEQALAGVSIADTDNPIEAMRIVRSFDPCIACAVH